MQVIRAEAMGMCFGVRDALQLAFARDDAPEVTVYGELVHNEQVLARLRQQGFRMATEQARAAEVSTGTVLVTAHGIANRERVALEERGIALVDTTCPLVRKAHNAVLRLQEAGYFPVVIGLHGHVEVRGLTGDLEVCAVVADEAEARALRIDAPRIGVVSQTTTPEAVATRVVAAIRAAHPAAEVRFLDTICEPTRQRQAALRALLDAVECVVVVGGRGSNNSRQLVETCRANGRPAYLVQGASGLDPEWFHGCAKVGLTAGTSTLDAVIDEVEAALAVLPEPAVAPHGGCAPA
ncbi:MAG: 4-hydroxy-3-methylbut-2-enyl diphosphate reductase [Planctomycetes bacterium]|nr:4-hydroxy-3-methylbut-2-enyl diphosphate reductase [Planctomycetota bacterium]